MCEDHGPRPDLVAVLERPSSALLELTPLGGNHPTVTLALSTRGQGARCPVSVAEGLWLDVSLSPTSPTSWRHVADIMPTDGLSLSAGGGRVNVERSTLDRVCERGESLRVLLGEDQPGVVARVRLQR